MNRRLRREQAYAYGLITPSMVIVFGIIVAPMLATLVYTVVNNNMLSSGYGQFAGLSFYKEVLSSADFRGDLLRTLYFTLVSTFLETFLGLLIALLLNEKFPGVRFLRSIIIIPWAIPTVVNGSLWKLIFNGEYGVFNALLLQAGVIDAYQSWLGNPKLAMLMIIIADTWKMTPLAVIFFLAALQGINAETYEAARVDGAGPIRRFWCLTLPYLAPTAMVIIVMRTVEKFKAFDIFYLMTRGGPADATKTLMYDTYLQAFTNLNYSTAAVFAYLTALIVALMTLLYVRVMKRSEL
ncbi:MAG: carbohydrate ABC transporter permease [Anaerovoracaceae bacterium]